MVLNEAMRDGPINSLQAFYLAQLCDRAIIIFNGRRINQVLVADEESGKVIKYVEPLDFTTIISATGHKIQGWKYGTIWGRVRIIDHDEEDLLAEAYTRCDRG